MPLSLPIPRTAAGLMYNIARIAVGFMFACHGAQKLGLLGGDMQSGFMLFIGIAELAGGVAVMIGFLTQLAALGSGIIMIGAYVTAHMTDGLLPIDNGGEMALLYLAAFMIILGYGPGYLSADAMMKKH